MSSSARDDSSAVHDLLSGKRRGAGPMLLRGLLRLAEPFYSAAMRGRNAAYDSLLTPARLNVPVVSVGNITAGGTGKTPMVRLLATRLAEGGLPLAVLMRGYRRTAGGLSDEQELLAGQLARLPSPVVVHADADRVRGGRHILQHHPQTKLIILDDAFQHRRLHRDLDIVLIDAVNPFGYGHVHPRGLLREPLAGLRRAGLLVITRADLVDAPQLAWIRSQLQRYSDAPILISRHEHAGLRSAACPMSGPPDLPLEALAGRRIFAAAGIANPQALHQQLDRLPAHLVGVRWFADHHDYTEADLSALRSAAAEAQADLLVVTEKDWTKLQRLPGATAGQPPIARLELAMVFDDDGEQTLLAAVAGAIERGVEPQMHTDAHRSGRTPGH